MVGASWDPEKNLIIEAEREDICYPMPILRLVPVQDDDEEENSKKEEEEEDGNTYTCPLFQNSERSGDENFIIGKMA